MNRQQKRLLQRQGQVAPDGTPVARRSEPARRQPPPGQRTPGAPARTRTRPRDFLHEVNVEMRKVAWPSREETINYSSVVLVTLVVLIALIFGLDYAFQKAALFLFK